MSRQLIQSAVEIHIAQPLFIQQCTGLSLSSNSLVTLIFIPVANLLLYGRIVSTTGQFTCNIKGPSNIPRQVLWVMALIGSSGVLCSLILLSYVFPMISGL